MILERVCIGSSVLGDARSCTLFSLVVAVRKLTLHDTGVNKGM